MDLFEHPKIKLDVKTTSGIYSKNFMCTFIIKYVYSELANPLIIALRCLENVLLSLRQY